LLANQPLSFKDKLNLMTRLAEDQNSGVREWAWLAIRPDFAKNLPKNIPHLTDIPHQNTK
jgi:hypothetical protein